MKTLIAILGAALLAAPYGALAQSPEAALGALKAQALAGDAQAAHDVGEAYRLGRAVEPDPRLAVQWYRVSAEGRSPTGTYRLGHMYNDGLGVPQSAITANRFIRKAAELGAPEAKDWLDESDAIFSERVKAGDPDTASMEASDLVRKAQVPGDLAAGMRALEQAVSKGSAYAKTELAVLLLEEKYVPADTERALALLKEAAEDGETLAMYVLAITFYYGTAVPADTRQAVEWFDRAAWLGDSASMCWLGYLHNTGKGVPQDYAMAATLFELSVRGADPEVGCVTSLAVAYRDGAGVPMDKNHALWLFELAVDLGDETAVAEVKRLREDPEARWLKPRIVPVGPSQIGRCGRSCGRDSYGYVSLDAYRLIAGITANRAA